MHWRLDWTLTEIWVLFKLKIVLHIHCCDMIVSEIVNMNKLNLLLANTFESFNNRDIDIFLFEYIQQVWNFLLPSDSLMAYSSLLFKGAFKDLELRIMLQIFQWKSNIVFKILSTYRVFFIERLKVISYKILKIQLFHDGFGLRTCVTMGHLISDQF